MYFERKFNAKSDNVNGFVLQCLVLKIWTFFRGHFFGKNGVILA